MRAFSKLTATWTSNRNYGRTCDSWIFPSGKWTLRTGNGAGLVILFPSFSSFSSFLFLFRLSLSRDFFTGNTGVRSVTFYWLKWFIVFGTWFYFKLVQRSILSFVQLISRNLWNVIFCNIPCDSEITYLYVYIVFLFILFYTWFFGILKLIYLCKLRQI